MLVYFEIEMFILINELHMSCAILKIMKKCTGIFHCMSFFKFKVSMRLKLIL